MHILTRKMRLAAAGQLVFGKSLPENIMANLHGYAFFSVHKTVNLTVA